MNIYALKGHKVCVVTLDAGQDHHKQTAKQHLELSKEYTVERTEVGSWHTNVYLQEIPDIAFNSVLFEDVSEQLDNHHHPDYSKYHK